MRSCVNESTFVLMCFWVFCGEVVDGEGKPIGVIVHESPRMFKKSCGWGGKEIWRLGEFCLGMS